MDERPREEREYVLGTHEEELRRLGFQHQVWAPQTTRAWERAGFGPGQRLLDLGSGPGYATLDLAALAGETGAVLAVDVSQRFLAHLARSAEVLGVRNVRWEEQDAESLSLPPASFDGAFARWVLCFTRRPEAVLRGVAAALRPGGRFVVMDYCRYEGITLAPPHPAFERVIQATARSVRARGGSMDIGQELPGMMVQTGFKVERVEPVVRLARPGSALWKWPESFFTTYIPSLVETGMITEEDGRAFHDAWRERAAEPGAFLLTPPMVTITAVRRP